MIDQISVDMGNVTRTVFTRRLNKGFSWKSAEGYLDRQASEKARGYNG